MGATAVARMTSCLQIDVTTDDLVCCLIIMVSAYSGFSQDQEGRKVVMMYNFSIPVSLLLNE